MRRLIMACVLAVVPGLSFAQTAPYQGAPLCSAHNDRAWHALWNAEDGCHYDHQHGDDPSSVNDIFGTSLFDLMGGTISHPWQTFSAAGYENDLKHAGYFWHVQRDLPCVTAGCITAFRLLVHQHPSGRDAAVRFHSAVLEVQGYTATTGVGYAQIPGMWVDFGDLLVDGVKAIDEPIGTDGLQTEPGRHKQHQSFGTPQIIWYGASQATHVPDRRGRIPRGFAGISTSVHDVWDHTSADDPADFSDTICPDGTCRGANATLLRAHLLALNGTVGRRADTRPIVDADGDGIINWSGYFDRYGVPQQAGVCGAPSLDCVPVVFENISTAVSYDCAQVCAQRYVEHDVLFGNQTSGWSQPRP